MRSLKKKGIVFWDRLLEQQLGVVAVVTVRFIKHQLPVSVTYFIPFFAVILLVSFMGKIFAGIYEVVACLIILYKWAHNVVGVCFNLTIIYVLLLIFW